MGKRIVGDDFRIFLMAFRQSVIILLGALEDYLELPRSIVPRRKRDKVFNHDNND
jgi:hypothetical protein